MKDKDIKNLARKIAKAEYLIQNSKNKKVIKQAKEDILNYSESITSLEEMMLIDDEIRSIFSKNNLEK